MKDTTTIQAAINQQLTKLLEDKHCISGKLTCTNGGNGLHVVLYGELAGQDKPYYFPHPGFPLQGLLRLYMEQFNPELATFSIDMRLDLNQFNYEDTTPAQQATQQKAEYVSDVITINEEQLALKASLQADNSTFGPLLATGVANRLERSGSFGYSHRDYCGTGFEYKHGAGFLYGEIWDGYGSDQPIQAFSNKPAFIDWLARQSNASLSMTHLQDPFYWGNQVITRERLEQFIAGGS